MARFTSKASQGKPARFNANAADTTLPYKPQPRQRVFHACGAEVVGYGGAAGGGKSMAILAELYMRAREIAGSYNIAFRRTYPELEKSLILKSRQLFPKAYCKYNEMTRMWTVRPKDGGPDSFIAFGYCRNAKEAEDLYKSAEFTTLALDESTLWDWDTVRFLMSRARSSIPGVKPRRIFATNPGGIGHMWFKEYFGIFRPEQKGYMPPEITFTPEPTEDDPEPMSRCFIPAKLSDNPALMDNDPSYRKTLMLLPEHKRKQLLDGDWEVFEGRFFPEFTDTKNVIDSFEIPKHWKVYRSLDYGHTAPFSCHWYAISPDGHVYVIREAYFKGLIARDQAIMVRDMTREAIEYTVGDPSMYSKKDGKSVAEDYMAAANIAILPGSNDRVQGWAQCRNMLAMHSDGKPIFQVFNTCPMLIKEINMAVYGDSEKNPDDINIHSRHDHALDDWRYFAASRPDVPREPQNDPYARLDEASRREWERHDEKIRKMRNGDPRAVLHDLHREEDVDDLP